MKTENKIIDFSDLDDFADHEVNSAPRPDSARAKLAKEISGGHTRNRNEGRDYLEFPCKNCSGSGVTTFYVRGMGWGQSGQKGKCPKCKGKGGFKTSPEVRAERRANAAEKKAREAVHMASLNLETYERTNPVYFKWLNDNADSFDFAASLLAGVKRFGGLTEGQENAVKKIMAKNAERDAARKVEADKRADEPTVTFPKLLAMLVKARQNLKYPKLRLVVPATGAPVVLQLAGEKSRYCGSINITDGGAFGDNVYYGRINAADAALSASRSLTPEVKELLVSFERSPLDAVKIQGIETGRCCCCGRELTNPESVAAGIGPICAGRFGI